ncbi:hypothetical protein Tco_1222542 [Tanacetum coccineum]
MATCHHLSGATWCKHCSVTVGQPPPDHRSTVVNGDSQRWSTAAVNGGQRRSTPPDHRSTATINDGQQRRTTVDHRRTTVDHRRTTGQRRWSTTVNGGEPPLTTAGPPVNHWVMVGSGRVKGRVRPGQVGSWAGSGSGLVRVEFGLGPPRGTTWQLTWIMRG